MLLLLFWMACLTLLTWHDTLENPLCLIRTSVLANKPGWVGCWLGCWPGCWLCCWLGCLLACRLDCCPSCWFCSWLGSWLSCWLGSWLSCWLGCLLSCLLGSWLSCWVDTISVSDSIETLNKFLIFRMLLKYEFNYSLPWYPWHGIHCCGRLSSLAFLGKE